MKWLSYPFNLQNITGILSVNLQLRLQCWWTAYHQADEKFRNARKQANKLMIVAFEKVSGSPAFVVLLLKACYPLHLRPLSKHPIEAETEKTTRKLYWKLSHCIRRADQRSMCLGDICIYCGIEKVFNRENSYPHWASTAIWLILAGGFKNTHLHSPVLSTQIWYYWLARRFSNGGPFQWCWWKC